ncbi:hypothetical protein BDY19DRAFT_944738 [Irpex rosettiformis]|uniref:Uncharacterized protein n=1 Tax=Irpex rosettiformis TaxID=378272 RepID=A0ACB8U529_9APHY|nr:hypothetical protein BDY19DRAFT_944738 [Irpex rosettiformis]
MATMQVDETAAEVKPFITYPPFLTPPPGVKILPFTQFKEPGIAVRIDVDETDGEVDGLGVPTVTLNSRHDLTQEERKMGKKRLANATQITADGQVRRIAWHEEWRSHEKAHQFSYDPNISEFDRLWQASGDFKNSRAWPPTSNPLSNIWDQIRLYIGLISSIQPPSKRKKGGQAPVEADEDDEDFVTIKEVALERVDDREEGFKISSERKKEALKDSQAPLDETALDVIREDHDAKKDQRLQEFLHDTETYIKIFFSAHWRDRGFAWDKTRSESCPILMGFFLRFLVFYNAFPEPDIQRGLQRAIKIAAQAEKELPATFVVAKALEDGISKGLKRIYGGMSNTLKLWDSDKEDVEDADADADFPNAANTVTVDAGVASADLDDNSPPNVKKRKLENGDSLPTASSSQEEDIIVINSSSMNVDEAALKDAVADNLDINGAEVAPTGDWGSAWGSGAWGSGASGGWGDAADSTWNVERPPTPAGEDADDGWKITEDFTLENLLGDTAKLLADTHTTGIVERSTRRVVRVVKPPETKSEPRKAKSGSAETVEAELENKLAYVVLAPWKKVGNHIASDVTLPIIQDSSRGDGFDPSQDEIQVLLDPATCDKLPIGVGLTATWVQLARKDGEKTKQPKKSVSGKVGEPTKWWYMEQFMATLVSFHTDRYYPDQD